MIKEKSNLSLKLLVLFIITIVGLLCYFNSFNGSFLFDDRYTIVENSLLRNLQNIRQLYDFAPTRFLANLTFALNYQMNGLAVVTYHATNFVIHIINAVVIFFLVRLILNSHAFFFPLTVALFFLVHPIQTQAVTYISQRYSLLAALFYLLSLYFYIRGVVRKRNGWDLLAALFFQVLAMFSKENTFTLPLAILLTEYTFFSRGLKKLLKQWFWITPFFLMAFIFYILMFKASFTIDALVSLPSVVQEKNISRMEYLLTQLNVVRTYIRLLIFPLNQNIDYDYPTSKTFFNASTIFSFLLHAILIIFAIWIKKRNRLISFAILFFYIALSAESSIIPIADVIAEHRLYLPSFGFSIFITAILFSKHFRSLSIFFLCLIIVSLSFLTYQRNKVWQNQYTLWSDTVRKSPGNWRPHYNLGIAYFDKEKYQLAKLEYKKALELKPEYFNAYNNLGTTYEKMDLLDQAIDSYLKGLYYGPQDSYLHLNLARAYLKKGLLLQSFWEYEKVLTLDPNNPSAHNDLGIIYVQQGKLREAAYEFETAIRFKPDYLEAKYNLEKVKQ